jgi:uncharacterized metal-binding protein YceD (DUF177 family)
MTIPAPEFSRLVTADRIPPTGIEQDIEARPAERAALAKRFSLLELKKLTAHLSLALAHDQGIHVTGKIKADIVQNCVVTLDPVTTPLDLDIDLMFVPDGARPVGAGSPDVDSVDEEFEIYLGGRIDLGEMVAQHMGISIDPYPRKPDARLSTTQFGPAAERPRPFSKLADLGQIKAKRDKKGEKTDD